ncbi:ADP-ribosylglycohydrolase family protein [Candidatus Woesearchaeota archaeon]|nr:ADP-ribosylglycohydrolase family protein [Candidatus Woesearchaeota archaeon]
MILDMAVGDAFGAQGEFQDRRTLDALVRRPLRYRKPAKPRGVVRGNYTDDTQMAIVVAEHMLSGSMDKSSLADGWVRQFHADKRPGYTTGFYGVLDSCKDGKDLLRALRGGRGSTKSGAAMRAPPIGLYSSKREVKQAARMQGEITHRDSGVEAGIAAALMVHYFRQGGKKAGLRTYIAREVRKAYGTPWPNGREPSSLGWECVSAAIQAVQDNDNIPDLLVQCISYGGDTDSVAAMAMAAASVSKEYRQAHERYGKARGIRDPWKKRIPAYLYSGLEPEAKPNVPGRKRRQYGREYLKTLDDRLFRRF